VRREEVIFSEPFPDISVLGGKNSYSLNYYYLTPPFDDGRANDS
jgi:hypothetical protein